MTYVTRIRQFSFKLTSFSDILQYIPQYGIFIKLFSYTNVPTTYERIISTNTILLLELHALFLQNQLES